MKAEKLTNETGEYLAFWCPGCKCYHTTPVTGSRAWNWNGDLDRPTLTPSLLVNKDLSNPVMPRCHSFIREGYLEFLSDCTHAFAGKRVEMDDLNRTEDA